MKQIALAVFLSLSVPILAQSQPPKPPTTLRGVLLEQLRSTHNKAEWFVPANTAVEGLTVEQAKWTDGKGNHSIGQLTYHLVFWNTQALARFKGEKTQNIDSNEETFNNFDAKQWDSLVRQLDQVMTDWEKAVEAAADQKLAENASTIAHVGTHNAYHIGQIVFVRKEQGSWDPSKGVK